MTFKNDNGTIPKGLRIDIMRQCMENKGLLTDNQDGINTYMGTGEITKDGVSITKAVDIKDGYFKCTTDILPISQGGIEDNNFENRVYELTVNTTLHSRGTKQFSSMKGTKGIFGTSQNIGVQGDKVINPYQKNIFINIGLLRFFHRTYYEIRQITTVSFSSDYIYFIPYYRGGCSAKILTSREEIQEALNQGFEIYEAEGYDDEALYFMVTADGDCDCTVLESYNKESFIQEIIKNKLYPSFNKILYFSVSNNTNYLPMGYSQLYNGSSCKYQFEYIKSTLETPVSAANSRYTGYTERYVVEGEVMTQTTYRFTKIQKYIDYDTNTAYDLVADSESQAHYMILYKIIENPTS